MPIAAAAANDHCGPDSRINLAGPGDAMRAMLADMHAKLTVAVVDGRDR